MYCLSRGDAGVVPYWTGDEEGDVYGGDVALPWAGSDEPDNSVCTSGPDGVLQMTGSLLLQIILYCLIIIYFLSYYTNLTMTKSLPGSLRRIVHSVGNRRCTVTVYITSGAMASGDAGGSRPRVDRSGVSFLCELQTSCNAPESYVTLESLGVVELDS